MFFNKYNVSLFQDDSLIKVLFDTQSIIVYAKLLKYLYKVESSHGAKLSTIAEAIIVRPTMTMVSNRLTGLSIKGHESSEYNSTQLVWVQ